jgi:hypothetical protein
VDEADRPLATVVVVVVVEVEVVVVVVVVRGVEPSDYSKLLAVNKKYKAVLTTGAKDKADNALAKDYSWTFRTGSS